MSGKDGETRNRVLGVATRLFAARGFEKVTVREICREAGANVAAVNYHFGDKLGLYQEVLGRAIVVMQETTEIARAEGAGRPAEDRLRIYISVFMRRAVQTGRDSWIHGLMTHEMATPTPVLSLVIDQVVRPRLRYLRELIGEMLQLPPDDQRVQRCVVSVQTQFHALMMNPVAKVLAPDFEPDDDHVAAWVEHITTFSLSGINATRNGVRAGVASGT